MHRKNTLHYHRGFTLIELTIVMAITAIIATMIVSFSVLISAQVKKNNIRADFINSVASLQTDLQKEFAAIDSETTFIVTENDKGIKFEDTTILLESYKYIDHIEIRVNEEKNLLKIILSNDDLGEAQSFLIYSHCGANFRLGV